MDGDTVIRSKTHFVPKWHIQKLQYTPVSLDDKYALILYSLFVQDSVLSQVNHYGLFQGLKRTIKKTTIFLCKVI